MSTSNSNNVVDAVSLSPWQAVREGNFRVGTSNRVALQTAQGIVNGEKRERVRVLFDSGSQKTFVTARLANDVNRYVEV